MGQKKRKPPVSSEEQLLTLEKKSKLEAKHSKRKSTFETLAKLAIDGTLGNIDYNDINTGENIRDIDQDSGEFSLLTKSISEHGILQNLVVELREADEVFELVCLSGHRRILALKKLHKHDPLFTVKIESYSPDEQNKIREAQKQARRVPCKIQLSHELSMKWKKDSTRTKNLEIALSENLFRADMHFIEQARCFQKLIKEGLSPQEIESKFQGVDSNDQSSKAKKVSRRSINRLLNLIQIIPEKGQELILEYPDAFSLKYLLSTYVESKNSKKRAPGGIIKMLDAHLKKYLAEPGQITRMSHTKSNEIKTSKLESFFQASKLDESQKDCVIKAMEYVGFIKPGSFPPVEKSSCNP
ncbi:MAG: ParB/RepB/Spo0J family partition protein [Oligoflexales bacterium]